MSAVFPPLPTGEGRGEGQRVEEPSAKYLAQVEPGIVRHFDLLAASRGGAPKLRKFILTLAVQGKLVPQDPSDEPASVLLQKIRQEKDRLIAEGKIRRDKPLAEIGEEERPFVLPASWEWVRFAEASINRDGERIPVASSDRESRAKIYDYYGASGVIDKIDHFLFDKTLLLIGEDGANLINRSTPIAFLAHGRYWVNNHAHVIDTTHPELMNYLALFINSISLESYVTGTAQPKMNQAKLNGILVALPPLAEQFRIVTRVEELTRLCDALEAKGQLEAAQHERLVSTLLGTLTESETPEALAANWQRIAAHFDLLLDRPEAVDVLEQSILQLAVRGLLVPQDPRDEPASVLLQKIRIEKDRLIAEGKVKHGAPLAPIAEDERLFGLPDTWEWVRVGEVVEMLNGYAFKSEWFKSSGIRLLRNVNVAHGKVDWTQAVFIDRASATEFEQFALRQGDVVLSLDRPIISTGLKFAVLGAADLPCLLLQRVARLAPRSDVMSADFLVLWLESDLFLGTIDPGRSNGVPHISTKQVGELVTGLPPLAEQSRIVARVESLRRLCTDLRQRLVASQTTQAHLAEALVEQAV